MSLAEAKGESLKKQADLHKQIAEAIYNEAVYLQEHGGSEEEIVKLWADYFKELEKISDLTEEMGEKQLEQAEALTARRESELELLEARGASSAKLIAKENQIIASLQNELAIMIEQGASAEEINKKKLEIVQHEQSIAEIQKKADEERLKKAESITDRRKSELDLLEAQGASSKKLIAKENQIISSLNNELAIMIEQGASAEEINKKKLEIIQHEQAIEDIQKKTEEERLKKQEDRTSLLESELSLLNEQDAPVKDRVAKEKQIIKSLNKELQIMIEQGASQEEINKKKEEILEHEESVAEMRQREREEAAQAQAGEVSRLKSEYDLMVAQGKPVEDRIAKQKEIRSAINQEIRLLRKSGASEEEINRLRIERISINKTIKELEKEEAKAAAEAQANEISKLKARLELYQAKDVSLKKQILLQRQIADAILEEIELMKKAGASREEILKKDTEYYNVLAAINGLEKSLLDDMKAAAQGEIDKINKKRNEELENLKKQYEVEDETNELEEKKLALLEAQDKLRNAEEERTVRIYNAAKGEWEWVANAKNVAAAKKDVENAQKAIDQYYEDKDREAKEDAINAKYDSEVEQWQKIIDALTDPAITVSQAIKNLEKNATLDMKGTIDGLNKILGPLGYHINTSNLYDDGGVLEGIGGIKATSANEMVLPPDITKAMLNPTRNAMFNQSMSELRYMYGLANSRKGMGIGGDQYNNGTFYQYGGITLTESQAKSTTIYELAKMSRGLRSYVATGR